MNKYLLLHRRKHPHPTVPYLFQSKEKIRWNSDARDIAQKLGIDYQPRHGHEIEIYDLSIMNNPEIEGVKVMADLLGENKIKENNS